MYAQTQSEGGGDLRLYMARPAAPGPIVLVLHAWWGLVPDVTAVCDRLAAAGYFAVAPDLHGGKVADTIAEAERLAESRSTSERVAAAKGALRWAQQQQSALPGPVALLGFSLGAATALRAAAEGMGDAVVVFYGSGETGPADKPILAHMAEQDEYEPDEWVKPFFEGLRQQGTPLTVKTWPGTGHWFFEPSCPAYQPEAAEAAWEVTVRFLNEHLRGEMAQS